MSKQAVRIMFSIFDLCWFIILQFLNPEQTAVQSCRMTSNTTALTLADARWLGSSLDWSAPTPRLGSWVWKTVMRPPVGDSSLKAACRAEPNADWVSMVFSNKLGRLFSRSCTSWKTNIWPIIDPWGKTFVSHSTFPLQGGQNEVCSLFTIVPYGLNTQ